jgi:triphosphatase
MTERTVGHCVAEEREAELKLVSRAGNRVKKPSKAKPSPLQPGITAARSFQLIGLSCLQHLLANEPVFRAERDPEAVHQMRVAIRRLRAAMSIFKEVAVDGQSEAVKRGLRRLAGELGEARDIDIFIAKAIAPARERHPDDEDLAALAASYEARRKAAYERALEAVTSGRFARIVLDTTAWLESGPWLLREKTAAMGEEPVEAFAAKELARRAKRIRKRAKYLEALDPAARHEVRIAVKKLRYAAEFFTPLFTGKSRGKRAKTLRSALGELQDRLGDLNDIAVVEAMEHDAGHGRASQLIARELAARFDEHLKAAITAYREFAGAEPLWR